MQHPACCKCLEPKGPGLVCVDQLVNSVGLHGHSVHVFLPVFFWVMSYFSWKIHFGQYVLHKAFLEFSFPEKVNIPSSVLPLYYAHRSVAACSSCYWNSFFSHSPWVDRRLLESGHVFPPACSSTYHSAKTWETLHKPTPTLVSHLTDT